MTTENRDAEIIAASTKYCAAEVTRHALFVLVEDDDERDDQFEPLYAAKDEALNVLANDDVLAVSVEAIRARATALTREIADTGVVEGVSLGILRCLLNDLLGAGSYPWIPFPPSQAEVAARAANRKAFEASALSWARLSVPPGDFNELLFAGHWPEFVGHEEEVLAGTYKPPLIVTGDAIV